MSDSLKVVIIMSINKQQTKSQRDWQIDNSFYVATYASAAHAHSMVKTNIDVLYDFNNIANGNYSYQETSVISCKIVFGMHEDYLCQRL